MILNDISQDKKLHFWLLTQIFLSYKRLCLSFCLSDHRDKQVAQGQYVVSDTRCPALHGCESEWEEAGQRPRRGQSPVEQGDFCLSVRQSPPGPLRPEICPLRPEICPVRPEIWEGIFEDWEDRFQAWEGRFQVWKGRFQAWEGKFQAWESRFWAWEGLGGTNLGRTKVPLFYSFPPLRGHCPKS